MKTRAILNCRTTRVLLFVFSFFFFFVVLCLSRAERTGKKFSLKHVHTFARSNLIYNNTSIHNPQTYASTSVQRTAPCPRTKNTLRYCRVSLLSLLLHTIFIKNMISKIVSIDGV